VKKILEDIKNNFNVDENRIYATGMSNGARFSYRLACEMSDTFAAIAAVSGVKSTISCNPSRPIPILHLKEINVIMKKQESLKSEAHTVTPTVTAQETAKSDYVLQLKGGIHGPEEVNQEKEQTPPQQPLMQQK